MELTPMDIDITALGEVGFAEQGSLTEDGAGYTLFWSGKEQGRAPPPWCRPS